jgi:hypothetical protein
MKLRFFAGAMTGAWGRGAEFAASESITLGLRQTCSQADAMPQLSAVNLIVLFAPAPGTRQPMLKESNINTRASG